MEIYFMHKDGISIGSSTVVLLVNVTIMLFATITMALINLLFNYQYLNSWLIAILVFGILINTAAIILFLIAVFNEKILDKFIIWTKKLLQKIDSKRIKRLEKNNSEFAEKKIKKINQNYEKRASSLDAIKEKYSTNATTIKKNKFVMLKTLITYYIQYFIYFSISYWAYRSVGLNEKSLFEITSLQSIVFAAISGLPSPGAVGVSEGAYYGLFNTIIPENYMTSVMLLNRIMNFYLFVLIAGIVVVFAILKNKKKEDG